MKNVQKLFALLLAPVFMLCMFTSCAPAVESSSISTVTTPSSTTTSTTEAKPVESIIGTTTSLPQTYPLEIDISQVTSSSGSKIDETITESQEPIEEKIVPLNLVTEKLETPYTEFESLSMLINNSKLRFMTSASIVLCFNGFSDNPTESVVKEWGCYPSALLKIIEILELNSYITDLTGSEPSTLYEYINSGIPVAVWVTDKLAPLELEMESAGFELYGPHECVTLVGYSESSVMVWSLLQDKYVTYDRALFEQRFEEMGSMALVVDRNS